MVFILGFGILWSQPYLCLYGFIECLCSLLFVVGSVVNRRGTFSIAYFIVILRSPKTSICPENALTKTCSSSRAPPPTCLSRNARPLRRYTDTQRTRAIVIVTVFPIGHDIRNNIHSVFLRNSRAYTRDFSFLWWLLGFFAISSSIPKKRF